MRTRYSSAAAALALLAVLVVPAAATPTINGALIQTRIFNDCPGSILNTLNGYPGFIRISDDNTGCDRFTNLHNWRLSSDGGASAAVFNNGDCFRVAATLTLTKTGVGIEGGLQISPWWSKNVDGRLQVRLPDGVIEGWGGVLPAFNFTTTFGVTYTGGPIYLEMIYFPHSNTLADPGTIEYIIRYNNVGYSSGPLPFGNCNLAEEPVYGCYGILNDARVGGWVQGPNNGSGTPIGSGLSDALWENIQFEALCPVPTLQSTVGRIKAQYR